MSSRHRRIWRAFIAQFPDATAAGGFSWQSSSVLNGFYQAQVLRNSQGPEGTGYNVPVTDRSKTPVKSALYGSGIDGLPTGTSGTFNAGPLESGSSPFGPSALLVGTNSTSTVSVAIGAANTVSLGFEQDVVSYTDSPVTSVDVSTTVLLPTPHTAIVPESAAAWLAANPGQNLPGNVSTSVDSTVSNVASQSAAMLAISTVNNAINTVSEQRAKLGAYESQFNFSSQDIATIFKTPMLPRRSFSTATWPPRRCSSRRPM